MDKHLLTWIIFNCLITYCEGGCTWPSPFVSSTWLDNTRGTIVFGTDTLSGWSMTITGTTISTWECLDNSYFASEGILLVKATDTFSLVGANWITYLCLQMTGVSSNSYTYYQQAERDSKGEDERALFSQSGLITDKATICSSSTVPSAEFHFMVKQGEEVASIQKCASPLLNKFNYEVTDTSNTVTCSGDASWDVCTNTSMMTFDYSLCPTDIAYSSGSGEVYCMASITASGFDYSVVYSTGSFVCIVSNSNGTAATFVNNNCTVDQTPTVFAMSPDGTNIGYKTTMTVTESCFTTTTTTTTTSTTSTTSTTTSNTTSGTGGTTSGDVEVTNPSTSTPDDSGGSIIPMVAGAAVGVLLLLAILFLIYWFCYRKKRFCFKKKEVEHNDEAMNSVTGMERPNFFDTLTNQELVDRYRFDREGILFLEQLVLRHIELPTRRHNSLSALEKLLITLQYLATGSMHLNDADVHQVSQLAVARVITEVLNTLATADMLERFVRFPTTEQELDSQCQEFFELARFPRVVGVIDCTHIRIKAPSIDKAAYINRKGYHSIKVQFVFNAFDSITNVVARWPGSTHDSRILMHSRLRTMFEDGHIPNRQYHLLGDSGYDCKTWLLTPYIRPLPGSQTAYNRAHKITRAMVERGIGQLKRRFGVLHGKVRVRPAKVCKIVLACAVLHNICKQRQIPMAGDVVNQNDDNDEQNAEKHSNQGLRYRDFIANTYF